jgi:hypothetical protein
MLVPVLIIFIIIFLYLKYPDVFSFKSNFTEGRYVRLERESGSDPINVANFVVYDVDDKIILPNSLGINPGIALGDGKTPSASSADDLSDIVLIATTSDSSTVPYIEYDLGDTKKISKVIILNRKKYGSRMQKTILRILDSDRNQIVEKKITELRDIYLINI